ncbi:zinc finger CCHC domain-containing protein 7 [Seriola aureovittata]|uniref:zinc finger CCHC domain-containing protein 7 n=1 Tax=Seriola aureovittata TaxID=2871759 RepID=UPI0024BDA848|nr:zinc finger CCHC domain-containing protein 7 [Seriola aureovittata]
MYCTYQDREELEDDLYHEDDRDSEGSEANSELEFRLYSQLHYSSNAGEMEEQEGTGEKAEGQDSRQPEVTEETADANGELEHTGESGPPSPNISKLLQHLKKKKKKKEGEKSDNQKKGKRDPKGQRSSSLFEEVIVIDSGPDVISISDDDTADDEGVCALKGQGSHRLLTSTPAHQADQKRKSSLSVPVTVDSSSSESDSEESESRSECESDSSDSSDSPDSDCLENWMILGPGNQEGDQSISLNLEGGSDSNADAEEEEERSWVVSDKDREAQIYNKDKGARIVVPRVSNRYYTGKNVQCRNCNKTGHLSKTCPEPKKLLPCFLCGTPGHVVSECPNKHCNNCGLPGHLFGSCSERAYWHKQCHRCSMTGHFFDACPQIWRQYHITTKTGPPVKQHRQDNGRSPAYCYNCSRKGHFGHVCTRQKMFNGVFASIPFINHYDTVEDIKRRQHRLKLKVKELKKNGCFPTTSQTPVTPGPPKKKQKISHHKNNHQPNQTPHHTPKNHKPSPSHIFFSVDDFRSTTPKTSKFNKHKQQESTGSVKQWKAKRPVPTSRGPLPPSKLILDEADDFPRGGGKGEKLEKKRKKNRMKKTMELPPEGHRGSRSHRPCWTVTGGMQGSESRQENGEKKTRKRRNRDRRTADKKLSAPMYPTDENLFIIKQRKRNR